MSKLDTLIKNFNKRHKEDIAAWGINQIETEKIPFTSPRVNYMLYGGIPRGRIVEFAGEESGGKTTTALDVVANAQKLFKREWKDKIKKLKNIKDPTKSEITALTYLEGRGPKKIVYADCENTLDEDWMKLLKVDVEEVVIIKPMSQSAEQIFEMLLETIETDEVGLIVIDSLGVMLSAQAYEKTMEEKTYGGIAAALTLFSKKAEMLCTKYNCTLIGINQVRENLNSPYGGIITPGGRGWKHHCSVRLLFSKGQYIDDRGNELKRSVENPAGNLVLINIAKTKICKPDRRVGFYTLNYDMGIDQIADAIEVAIRYGIIYQAGSWFHFVDIDTGEVVVDDQGETIKIQGKSNLIEYLEDNSYLLNEILDKIEELI